MAAEDILDLTTDETSTILRDGYGLDAAVLDVVSGEAATVCKVKAGDGIFAMKASRSTPQALSLLRWQTAAMRRLTGLGLPVPALVPDLNGEFLHRESGAGGDVVVQLSAWLHDPPLSDVDVDFFLLRKVGAMAARVSQALADFQPLPHEASHVWELSRSADSIRFALQQLKPGPVETLARRALQTFEEELLPLLPELDRAVVHHDLHDSNLLIGIGADGTLGVTGILDFDDMVYGVRLAELAVAGAYAARNTPDAVEALLTVVEGWASALPMTEAEVQAIRPAAISRLAVNASVWASRVAGPRGDYAVARSGGRTLEALDQLLSVGNHEFVSALRRRVYVHP
ncbi:MULTISPECIES: phosphotransferase [unclassified Arthrobacter]|uniref:phosphotransferase n=1 Tax=unclassified Arthrobacter TaxID=235627 RepID=UPI0015E3AD9D|nr:MULTISPECIES: phosphotransferase [unclassified Arthrobacter]